MPATDSATSLFDLRKADFSLSPEQAALKDAYASLVEREAGRPGDGREDAESRLWTRMVSVGAVEMLSAGPPAERATLVDLSLVLYELGYGLVSSVFAETAAAVRLIASLAGDDAVPPGVRGGGEAVTLALADLGTRPSVLSGPRVRWVLGRDGSALVLDELPEPLSPLGNPAGLPFGRLSGRLGRRQVLAAGADADAWWRAAMRTWRILTAARLSGVAGRAVREAAAFAVQRRTRGVSIGSLQAVAHLVVDAEVAHATSRNLALKAAWFEESEPLAHPHLAACAYVHAVDASRAAARKAVHVHGGQGVALESAVSRCFLLATWLPLPAGDTGEVLDAIAGALLADGRFSRTAADGW